MRDAAVRAARTFAQAFLGFVATSGIIQAVVDSGAIDVGALRVVVVSATAAGVAAVVSFVQNLLEDRTGKVLGAK